MEIGIKPQINQKFKLTIFITWIVIFPLVLFLTNEIVLQKETVFGITILQTLISGLLFVLIMPPILTFLSQTIYKRIKTKVVPDLFENETIEFEGPANLFRGREGVGGKLFLTNQRVIFNSHKINIQTGPTSIEYSNIKSVEPRKTSRIVDNGILLKTAEKEFKIVVNERQCWMEEIEKKIELC